MQELIPAVLGLGIGIAVGRRQLSAVAGLLASLLIGTLVAWVTGELSHSIGYAILDSGVIVCTAVLAAIAQRLAWRARRLDRDSSEEASHG